MGESKVSQGVEDPEDKSDFILIATPNLKKNWKKKYSG
jgi:hypothetical protein